ncbi:DNA-binding protein [Waterburya agarophytonicola K14]|uniref:DNA-binding protein n=1 Tax=Waterburya agarophytonicola KI4 TaxID=2874699 RepID=A0A964BX25_9CYAN|nr:DNA-binding protein [Waterburya agarophytonicola]MCC0179812.1 DNA-binding protein [Waterburya agarophytonicola KI4]
MNEYDFVLHFKLADPRTDPSIYEDRLFEAGCDDALLGIGKLGYLGLDFIRTAENSVEAITSATHDVRSVIPDCELYYISPDVVSIPEIATVMQCSRQNVLKLKNAHTDTFPFSINSDAKSLNWHLAEVLKWYQKRGHNVDLTLLEVAEFAMQFNLEKQNQNINSDPDLRLKARALVS